MIDKHDKVHGKSFVIIGGDVGLINSLERMLLFAGASVKACTTGYKGISETTNTRPDIIILDDTISDMDAKEVISTLQKNDLTDKIPMILISDVTRTEEYRPLFMNGIQDYLPREEFDVMQVILRVEAILRKVSPNNKHGAIFDFSESDRNVSKTGGVHLVKLLVIEDDPLLRNLLFIRLQKNKIDHKFCHSGSDAIATAIEYKPTVIILDLMLPGMDGMEVLSKLRENHEIAHTPVIIFSNKDDDVERHRAKDLGVNDFLVKASTDLGALIQLLIARGK